jgi:flagellar export protein FliJ
MQNFRFSLDKVMSWRRTELQREEQRLAPLVAELGRLDGARNQNGAARERAETDVVAANSVYGSELEALAGYRVRLEKERIAIELQRTKCEDLTAGQRARVLDAHRRVRLLEKLRARQFEEWRTAWQREVENFSSETFLSRWGRE